MASDAIAAGVSGYVEKQSGTAHYELLANRIAEAVEQYRATQQLKRQQSKIERFQELLETAMTATDTYAWEWDLQSDTITRYPTPDPIYGNTDDEMDDVFESFPEPIHPDDREHVMSTFRRAANTGEDYQIEARVDTGGDSWTWVRDIGKVEVDDDGAPHRALGIITDITEQKAREQQLKQQNQRLEEFTNVVSHDLRNPLQVAEGGLELAQEECDSEHLERVDRALNRMDTLVDDLLTLAREGETISEFESVDLATLVEECWATVETADATLVIDSDRTIAADKNRLRQVFENLVRNAVKHGGDDVTVTVDELGDGFYIEDDGPGIPPDERTDLFDAGYSTNDAGTGFGLSIVKQIVDAHGWEIRLIEGTNGGTRFEITGVGFADE